MAEIEIEIDGQKLIAKPNQTVIQVADEANIYIPRFCYHAKLSIPANCRMCLVEIEKMPKAVPACATPVAMGMKVYTKSPKTLLAQRAVMEFLLINHPLDCPICDQGGECELQDLSMGYGSSHSSYQEPKRAVPDQDLGPLIATEMTRCIYCTRCVRFGDEIAGVRELGAIGRGECTEISTYVQHAMKSEVSGNIIDLCPVGALTSKPYRFISRPWELTQLPSVSPHDCLGTNLHVHTRDGKVMRVVSRENQDINQSWIADRDRFSYTGLYHPDRLQIPMVRINNEWETIEWEKALSTAAALLQETISEFGSDKLGALASPSATLEEFYLLQKIIRGLDSPHIDHRLRESDISDQARLPTFPGLNLSLDELESCEVIVLIGSNIQKEQPLAGLRVRQASLKGAKIVVVNPVDYAFHFAVRTKYIAAPHLMTKVLSELLAGASDDLLKDKKGCIILGALAFNHPEAATIRSLANALALKFRLKIGFLTQGGNAASAWLAGAVPHRLPGGREVNHVGLSAHEMLEKPRQAYILLNVEPELDCANSTKAIEALKQAQAVIALSVYRNPILEKYAHVILPMAPFTETAGTFINAMGTWQSVTGVAKPYHESRPGWKILRALGNFLELEHFTYESTEAIKHELKHQMEEAKWIPLDLESPANVHEPEPHEPSRLTRIGEIPIYAIDSLTRRAGPLQAAQAIMEGEVEAMRIHSATARKFQLQNHSQVTVRQQHGEVKLKVEVDDRIAEDAAWIAGGIEASCSLGALFGVVEIVK